MKENKLKTLKEIYGNKAVTEGIIKMMMMKEALASSQMEGIGLDLTLEDLY